MNVRRFLLLSLIGAALCRATALSAETNSPAAIAGQPPEVKEFVFSGGDVSSFVDKINKTFRVNLWELATIPESMHRVAVPKMRIDAQDFSLVFQLYNSISADMQNRIGKWVIKSLTTKGPNAIVLVGQPEEDHPQNKFIVKAFAYRGLSGEQLQTLQLTIDEQVQRLVSLSNDFGYRASVRGTVQYHQNAGILIATGPQAFIELADTIIEAFRGAHPPPPPPFGAPSSEKK